MLSWIWMCVGVRYSDGVDVIVEQIDVARRDGLDRRVGGDASDGLADRLNGGN